MAEIPADYFFNYTSVVDLHLLGLGLVSFSATVLYELPALEELCVSQRGFLFSFFCPVSWLINMCRFDSHLENNRITDLSFLNDTLIAARLRILHIKGQARPLSFAPPVLDKLVHLEALYVQGVTWAG